MFNIGKKTFETNDTICQTYEEYAIDLTTGFPSSFIVNSSCGIYAVVKRLVTVITKTTHGLEKIVLREIAFP